MLVAHAAVASVSAAGRTYGGLTNEADPRARRNTTAEEIRPKSVQLHRGPSPAILYQIEIGRTEIWRTDMPEAAQLE